MTRQEGPTGLGASVTQARRQVSIYAHEFARAEHADPDPLAVSLVSGVALIAT